MRFHHLALEVKNLNKSIAFYKKLIGFDIEEQFSFLGEEIVFLISKTCRLELISKPEGEPSFHLCFEVADLHESMKQMVSHRIIEGPYKLQNGWKTVFYEGPNQEIIELLQTNYS
ncbi:VOC family protein [Robertmurraya sp. Marseille-Q9965]